MATKYGYEAFLEDQKKREEEAKKGQVRYVEAAQASRPQYSLPGYQGKSQNQGKTYQWERDLMANEKIKGAGNSYTKKFDALTKRMNMTSGQAEELRKYLDFQEDSQHVDPKMNKDKTINQSQSLNVARDAHLKVDVVDGILNNMMKTTAAKVKQAKEKDMKFAENTQKAAENSTKERSGLLGFLDSTLGRAGDNALKVFGDQFANDNNAVMQQNNLAEIKQDPTDKQALAQLQMLNTTGREAQGGLEKTSDFVGRSLGEIAPYTIGGAYGAADAVLGKLGLNAVKSPLVKEAIRGVTAGGVVGTGKAIARDNTAENPEDFGATDYLKTIGLESALAGAGDAGIGAFARNINLKGQLGQVMNSLGGKQLTEEEMRAVAQGMELKPSGNPSNVLANPSGPTGEQAQQVLNSMLKGTPKPTGATEGIPQMGNVPIPQVEMPSVLDDIVPPVENVTPKDPLFEQLNFGQSSKYAPKARPDLSPVERSLDPMNRPQSYWKDRYESFADEIQKNGYNPDNLSKEALDELWTQYAKYDEPVSLENAVDLAYGKGPQSKLFTDPGFDPVKRLEDLLAPKPKEPTLKDALSSDPKIEEALAKLNELGPKAEPSKFALDGNYGEATMNGVDDILELLGVKKAGHTIENAPTPGLRQTTAEKLRNVNNSQAPEQALADLVQAVAKENPEKLNDLLMQLDGTVNPKPKTEAVKPAQADGETSQDEMLLRLNGQKFSDHDETNSLFSYSKNEPDQVGDHMNTYQKVRESLVNSLQKFQVVSNKLMKDNATEIKDNYKTRIESAKTEGRPEEAKRLAKEIKYLFKEESSLLKAAQNEETSYMITDDLIKSTYGEAEKALQKAKISTADAWEYQAAKNLDWFMKKGGHADYQLPKGWDEGRLVDIINKWKGNTAMDQFSASLNTIRTTRLDYLQKYGLKSTEEFDALSKNPHYIPMMKDFDWKKSSIESAMKVSGDIGKSNPNVMALGKGGDEFFANPIESLVGATYTSIRNSLRNGTHGEIAKLAQLDKEGVFIRPTKLKATHDGHVIEHYDNGVVQNYVISNDLADVIKDLRSPEKAAGIAEKVTGFMGSLKTTSIPYQARAIPRDWTQAIVNLDGNPISHLWNLMGTLKTPGKATQAAMKEGGAFHNAFKDGMGAHRTTHEMAQNFVKENRLKGGRDEIVEPKTLKEKSKQVIQNLWKLNIDYSVGEKLGNFGDSAPRLAAIKQVEKEYTPAIAELEGKIASTTNQFEKDTLTSELNDLKTQFQRDKIYKARDVINYSRSGSSKYAKFFKNYWNFANTATQSVDRYARQLYKKPISTLSKTLAIAAPMMGAQEIAYRNSSDADKKIYDDSPDFLKNTMYMFVVGGHRVMFPKPFEVAFVTSPLEGAINLTHQYDEEDAKKKVTDGVVNSMRELVPLDIGDLLTLNFSAPSIAQPVMEVANNRKNFNGKPISYYDRFKSSDAKSHFFLEDGAKMKDVASEFTSPTSRKLGEMINANPDYITHLIGGYGGDTGKNALAALDALIKPSTNRNKTITQNMNPLQDFYNSKKPTYAWRDSYTEKDKDKSKK